MDREPESAGDEVLPRRRARLIAETVAVTILVLVVGWFWPRVWTNIPKLPAIAFDGSFVFYLGCLFVLTPFAILALCMHMLMRFDRIGQVPWSLIVFLAAVILAFLPCLGVSVPLSNYGMFAGTLVIVMEGRWRGTLNSPRLWPTAAVCTILFLLPWTVALVFIQSIP